MKKFRGLLLVAGIATVAFLMAGCLSFAAKEPSVYQLTNESSSNVVIDLPHPPSPDESVVVLIRSIPALGKDMPVYIDGQLYIDSPKGKKAKTTVTKLLIPNGEHTLLIGDIAAPANSSGELPFLVNSEEISFSVTSSATFFYGVVFERFTGGVKQLGKNPL